MPRNDDLVMLLPFYVNGTLSAADRAAIDAALATEPAMRAALDDENRIQQIVEVGGAQVMQDADEPTERLDAVMGQLIDKKPAAPAPVQAIAGPGLASRLAFLNPANWHPALSLALALVALAQAAWIAGNRGRVPSENQFQTVSGPDGPLAANTPLLIVRIKDEANWADVQELLEAEHLTIVSGPTDGRLTLATDSKTADVAAILAHLSASKSIAFAGKVQ